MKKFITHLLLFIPVCVVLYSVMICLFGELAPKNLKQNLYAINKNDTYVRLQEINNYKNIDILFLGSSRAYSTFDVRTYENIGYTVFNLGTSGQTPIQTKILLDRYLALLNPKMIIYEVSPGTFASDGIESATDIMANGRFDSHSFKMVLKLKHLKVINSFIYRCYVELFNKKPNVVGLNINEKGRVYIKGGYVEVNQMEYNPLIRANNIYSTELNDMQFEEIIGLLKETNTKLILVQVPYVKKVYELYDNNQFNANIAQFAEYHDFNLHEEMVDLKYFRDNTHLNMYGVKVFNKSLIKQLNLEARMHNILYK